MNKSEKSAENKKNKLIINEPKPIINEYNWGVIHFPSEKDDRKKFEKNNVTITLNVLYAEQEKLYPAYYSKHNSNSEK